VSRFVTRFLTIQIIFWISAFFPDINTAADIGGAVLAPIVSIIVPSICYMKAYEDDPDSEKPNPRRWLFKYIYAFLATGVTLGVVGFTMVLVDLAKPQ